MPKKSSPSLVEEAIVILSQSDTLKRTVIWQDQQVDKLVSKYSDDEFDALSWEEKEQHLRQCEELEGRLKQSVKELLALDAQYMALRKQVKEKYGKDILPGPDVDVRKILGTELGG
jgi:hypothetical protein